MPLPRSRVRIVAGSVAVGHEEVLGDLQLQGARRQTPWAASMATTCSGRSVSTSELAERLTATVSALALPLPGRGLVERLVEHEPGHGGHQPGLLDQVEEGVGVEQAAGGVVPADQRLDAVDLAGAQVDLGLVVQDELVVGQRGPQLLDRPQPGRAVGVVGAAVDVMSGCGGLRLVHGDVGLAQQVAQVGAVVGEQGDADADVRARQLAARQALQGVNGSASVARRSCGNAGGLVAAGVLEQDRELVPPSRASRSPPRSCSRSRARPRPAAGPRHGGPGCR